MWTADIHPDTRCFDALGVAGEDDQTKGTQLLEVYALEIQMYTAQKDTKKLKVGPRAGESPLSGLPANVVVHHSHTSFFFHPELV